MGKGVKKHDEKYWHVPRFGLLPLVGVLLFGFLSVFLCLEIFSPVSAEVKELEDGALIKSFYGIFSTNKAELLGWLEDENVLHKRPLLHVGVKSAGFDSECNGIDWEATFWDEDSIPEQSLCLNENCCLIKYEEEPAFSEQVLKQLGNEGKTK